MTSKREIAEIRAEENRKIREFFIGYMKGKFYELDGKKLKKGFVVLTLMNSGRRVRGTDTNPDHKFPHIFTCLTPVNLEQADALYDMFELERKEMGKEIYKKLKGSKNERKEQ